MRDIVIGLALIGFAAGVTVRLRALILLLVLLVAGSIIFSMLYGFGFLETALTIMAFQVVVQASYFIGSVARAILARIDGRRWAI
jgi:hypothetical protein